MNLTPHLLGRAEIAAIDRRCRASVRLLNAARRRCLHCNRLLPDEPRKRRGPKRKHCSDRCRNAFARLSPIARLARKCA